MNRQSPLSFILLSIVKLVAVAGLVYLIYQVAYGTFTFGYRIFNEPPYSSSQAIVAFVIEENDSVMDIAQLLEDLNLVQNKYIFFLQEWFSKYHGDLLPGAYALSPSMTGEEMIELMATEVVGE